MKRRQNSGKFDPRWKRKNLFVVILVGFCFGVLLFMEMQYSGILSLSLISQPIVENPKIAFLFIARNRLPLENVWDAFFKGDKENKFSVFVHSRPGFLFNKATTRSMYFLNRQVNESVQVDWGEASMIQAERILIQNALMDPSNERFVFLSDSCIPLYNFSYTYNYIMSTSKSFVDSFADTKQGRYNSKMHPVIPVEYWRKGSQWVVLNKKHAEIVMKDDTVFPLFQSHCKAYEDTTRVLATTSGPVDNSKEHNCIPDEHYVPRAAEHLLTLCCKLHLDSWEEPYMRREHLEGQIVRRTLTHTSWDLSSSKTRERRGWHPVTYKLVDAIPALIQSIKAIDSIHFETEYRREWCTSKGKPAPCFLFARKFTKPAVLRLLNTSALGVLPEETSENGQRR